MLYDFELKKYKEYGREVSRKDWIKDWRQELFWNLYLDVDMYDVEDAITEYCEANKIQFSCTGCWLYCISNRKVYNDIMRIIDEILYYRYEEDCV